MKIKNSSQYSFVGRMFKKFLHTKIGAYIGYVAGISGFNRVKVIIRRADGKINLLTPSYNSRVNKGAALTASLMSGSSLGSISSPLPPIYIALSTSSLSPAAGDTTLSGETASSGMGRALGTVGGFVAASSLDGSASYTVSKTFSASGTIAIVSAGLFDAISSGNLFAEANLSSTASLSNGDTLQITWTINV